MATIEKRERQGKSVYRVKIRLRGHLPADATFDRITDAKRWAAETETAIRAGRWFQQSEAKRITLAELIDRYINEHLPTTTIPEFRPMRSRSGGPSSGCEAALASRIASAARIARRA